MGHLPDIRDLAGVTLATVLFNILYRGFSFLRMGTTGVTAQAVGRDDTEVMITTLTPEILHILTAVSVVYLCENRYNNIMFG